MYLRGKVMVDDERECDDDGSDVCQDLEVL